MDATAFTAVQDAVLGILTDLGPVIAVVGVAILGLVAAVALWFRFGPGLVKKVFSKAS